MSSSVGGTSSADPKSELAVIDVVDHQREGVDHARATAKPIPSAHQHMSWARRFIRD